MSINACRIFLHIIFIIMNGIEYCLTKVTHTRALDPSYRELRMKLNQRFSPCIVYR
jgi:hypothetical protein